MGGTLNTSFQVEVGRFGAAARMFVLLYKKGYRCGASKNAISAMLNNPRCSWLWVKPGTKAVSAMNRPEPHVRILSEAEVCNLLMPEVMVIEDTDDWDRCYQLATPRDGLQRLVKCLDELGYGSLDPNHLEKFPWIEINPFWKMVMGRVAPSKATYVITVPDLELLQVYLNSWFELEKVLPWEEV